MDDMGRAGGRIVGQGVHVPWMAERHGLLGSRAVEEGKEG